MSYLLAVIIVSGVILAIYTVGYVHMALTGDVPIFKKGFYRHFERMFVGYLVSVFIGIVLFITLLVAEAL